MGNCVGCEENFQTAARDLKKNASALDEADSASKKVGTVKPPSSVIGRTSENVYEFYNIGKELSRDNFGITYKCTEKLTGDQYSIKVVAKRKLLLKEDVQDLRREIAIMSHLDSHPNIIGFRSAYEDKHSVYLVMELCTGGELFDRIVSCGHYSEKQGAELIRAIIKGVQHYHSKGIIHRDLNPEKVLLASRNEDAQIKISGFDQAVFFKRGQSFTDVVGSPCYVAPEVLRRKYGPEVDIWSCGVILYILLAGSPPFWAENEQEIFDAILRGNIDLSSDPWPSISHSAKDLLRKLLVQNPKERLTATQVLEHEWIQEDGSAPDEPLHETVKSKLKQFSNMNKMKRVALKVISSCLSEKEIIDLKEVFRAMDTDNSGAITYDELKAGLRKQGSKIPDSQMMELMEAADLDNSGTIDYSEFITATMFLNKAEMEENMYQAFKYFDNDGSGFISQEELREALAKNHALSRGDIESIIAEVDTDHDGKIDYGEFCAMMRRESPALLSQNGSSGKRDSLKITIGPPKVW